MSGTGTIEIDEAKHEFLKCALSFEYFLKYVRIVEPPTRDNPGGIIPFEYWPHLRELTNLLLTKLLIVVLKSRQVGVSWLLAAYVLWDALFRTGSTNLLFSKGEVEAMELLSKCRRIYQHLPKEMHLSLDPKSATEMGFPAMVSSIKAFAATETAGVSFSASRIVDDEWDWHPYAAQNYLQSKPCRDAGGQFIGVFTVDSSKPDSLPKAVFRDALEGKNGFTPLFIPCNARPGRDEQWYEQTKLSIPNQELLGLTPELYMQRNYPRTIEEALSPIQTIAAFARIVLDEMVANTRPPVKVSDGLDPQVVHIYQPYMIGQYYITASDVAHGIGRDYSVTAIMNAKTGVVVADIFNNTLSPEEFALHTVATLGVYHNPLWYPEDNDWGSVVISKAQQLGYKNIGYRDDKKTKLGWHTSDSSRIELFGGLIPAINNRQIVIYNLDGLKQFYDIIRNAEKNGRIEPLKGRHDDYVVAVGICWAMKDRVNPTSWDAHPIESLTFSSKGGIIVENGNTKPTWKDILRK